VGQRVKKNFFWVISIFSLKEERAIPAKGSKGTIAALDGVRAIAAMLVVTLHLNEATGVPWNLDQNPLTTALADFGRTGVDLFFVLSGFLLFLPYAKALLFQDGLPAARTFYLRRIFRIWPGYYFSLIVMILWYGRQYLQPDHWKRLFLFLTFFMDSSHQTFQQLNGPFWTLAIEWQFYLLLPLIAFCFFWVLKRCHVSEPGQRLRAVLGCCGILILLSLAMRGFGVYCQRHPAWTFLVPRQVLNFILFFTYGVQGKYLEVFSVGMIVSVCYTYAHHFQAGAAFKAHLQRWSNWICRAGIILLICLAPWQLLANKFRDVAVSHFSGFAFLHPLISYYPWLGELSVALGYGLCVLAILFGSPALRWFFELPYMRWIGQISYGLYMWNKALFALFAAKVFHLLPGGVLLRSVIMWIFVFIVMLPLCALFYRFIEKPGIRLGSWVINRKPEMRLFLQRDQRQLQVKGSPER
jgi:peptidoglycan/LPS O-acetylase OafA/YrhL